MHRRGRWGFGIEEFLKSAPLTNHTLKRKIGCDTISVSNRNFMKFDCDIKGLNEEKAI